MAFPIEDLSQPFRRPSELRRLVEAVRQADEYDEARWIEWKSRLDLTDLSGKLHLVKQILGFANRDPAVAARWCQGNAYLLVGVSPGELQGVAAVDHQILVQSLQPYLGTEIVWTPEYVEVEGVQVLVVEVAPPCPGDPVHFLMKDLFITRKVPSSQGETSKKHGFHEGTIFTRRPGETERADHSERQMLIRRAQASQARLTARVTPDSPTIEATPALATILQDWTDRERAYLRGRRYRATSSSEDRTPGVVFAALRSDPDPRTQQEYFAEIEGYLEEMQRLMLAQFAGELSEHRPAHLALSLVNEDERPFQGVQVTVTLHNSRVRGIEPTGRRVLEDGWPKRPKPFGTPKPKPGLGAFHLGFSPGLVQQLSRAGYLPALRSNYRFAESPEQTQIIFEAVDLRPHARIPLDRVPLQVAPELVGKELPVSWTASAMDANGKGGDALTLTVLPSTLELVPNTHWAPESAAAEE